MNKSTVGAGAYTGPWAEVVFGPYKKISDIFNISISQHLNICFLRLA